MFQSRSQVGQRGLLYSEIRFRSLAGTVVTRVCVSMLLLLISAVGHTELVCRIFAALRHAMALGE